MAKKRTRRKTRKQRGGAATAPLKVHFGTRQVQSNIIPLANTQGIPSVSIQSGPTTLYTLIMHDPDAVGHSAAHPYLHWLVTDIPGPNFNEGNILFSYEAPRPPSGIHRYYFSLYEQLHGILTPQRPAEADQFDLKGFIRSNGLRLVAQVHMRVLAEK
jgi:protein FLOWERING LOCUS T